MKRKKMAQGLQFNVYDFKNKVKKIPTTKTEVKLKLLLWSPSYLFRWTDLEKEANKVIKERDETIKELKNRNIKSSLFANLEFKNGEITQDKVIPLKKLLKDFEKIKEYINQYVKFIFDCWENGFAEKTYNFKINYGIDSKGNIVLMDFGELIFRKKEVEKAIKIKRWEKSHNYKWSRKKLRDYYKKVMGEQITLENLNKYWKELE